MRIINGRQFIQTDSAINSGNSGGVLARMINAKIIGMITASVSPQGQAVQNIGLAIPVDVIQTYIQNILK